MATIQDLNVDGIIRRLIDDGKTHKDVAEELRRIFPNAGGVSARSVRRFCQKRNLHGTSRLPNPALDVLVAYSIGLVR